MLAPSKFAIELRDKDFILKNRLEPYVTNAKWEWNRIGGCGKCTLTVSGNYSKFKVQADDDIRIYLPDAGGMTASLWYRGYVESVTPAVQGSQQSIQIEATGYFSWLDRVRISDNGDDLVLENMEPSQAMAYLFDTYVLPKALITRGTFQASRFSVDQLSFNGQAKDALSTLTDLVGTVECGVDENLEFFWVNQGTSIKDRFFIGEKVTKLNDRFDFKNILNKVYFEGGKVNGVAFRKVGQSASSDKRYGTHEDNVSNGSITTDSTAQLYISGLIRQKGKPVRQMSISCMNLNRRIERNRPMGEIAIRDTGVSQNPAVYGTTANGGSNKFYGKTSVGGTGQLYGGVSKYQVDRVSYSFSPENGRVHADIQFGNSSAISRASAALKLIEQNLNAVRQRSL